MQKTVAELLTAGRKYYDNIHTCYLSSYKTNIFGLTYLMNIAHNIPSTRHTVIILIAKCSY